MQSIIIFLMGVVKELKYLHYHIIMANNLGNIVLGFIGIFFFILFAVIIATDSVQETIAGWFNVSQEVIFNLSIVGIVIEAVIIIIKVVSIYLFKDKQKSEHRSGGSDDMYPGGIYKSDFELPFLKRNKGFKGDKVIN